MLQIAPAAVAGSGVLAVFLIVVLIAGYVVIWAIWHFGFRDRDDEGRRVTKPRE